MALWGSTSLEETMLKYMLTTALVAAGLAASAGGAGAADKYTFALVPKNTNNPFYDQALAGCKKAEKELAGKVDGKLISEKVKSLLG